MQESQHRTGHTEDTLRIQVEPWDFARAALPAPFSFFFFLLFFSLSSLSLSTYLLLSLSLSLSLSLFFTLSLALSLSSRLPNCAHTTGSGLSSGSGDTGNSLLTYPLYTETHFELLSFVAHSDGKR